MASISSSEVISVISDTPVRFISNAYSQYGSKIHRRIQGNLQRRPGTVFAGFEGESLIPNGMVDVRRVDVELNCEASVGEGVITTAQLDAVLDSTVCLEIKSGGNSKEAGLRWLQLGLNAMVWSLDRGIRVAGRLMYFYNTNNLYYLPGDGRECWTYLSAIACMACQIRDRQERIDQNRRSYSRATVTTGGQRKAFVAGRGEANENYQYSEFLGKENFDQGKVMRGLKQIVIAQMMLDVEKVE